MHEFHTAATVRAFTLFLHFTEQKCKVYCTCSYLDQNVNLFFDYDFLSSISTEYAHTQAQMIVAAVLVTRDQCNQRRVARSGNGAGAVWIHYRRRNILTAKTFLNDYAGQKTASPWGDAAWLYSTSDLLSRADLLSMLFFNLGAYFRIKGHLFCFLKF